MFLVCHTMLVKGLAWQFIPQPHPQHVLLQVLHRHLGQLQRDRDPGNLSSYLIACVRDPTTLDPYRPSQSSHKPPRLPAATTTPQAAPHHATARHDTYDQTPNGTAALHRHRGSALTKLEFSFLARCEACFDSTASKHKRTTRAASLGPQGCPPS